MIFIVENFIIYLLILYHTQSLTIDSMATDGAPTRVVLGKEVLTPSSVPKTPHILHQPSELMISLSSSAADVSGDEL